MKKILLFITLCLSLSATQSYAKATGYTYFAVTDCGSDIEKRYGTYCAAVISQVFRVYDCDSHLSMCGERDWGDDVETHVSSLFSSLDAVSIFPEESKREAKNRRNKVIRDWKSSDYTILKYPYRD